MEEEDDDFYAPDENIGTVESTAAPPEASATKAKPAGHVEHVQGQKPAAGAEVGDDDVVDDGDDDDDDESDSDIDIITERKDGSKAEPPPRQTLRPNSLRAAAPLQAAPAETGASEKPSPQPKAATPAKTDPVKSGADYPAVKTSTIDVDADPVYGPAGKAISEVNIDEDLKEHEKPWRVPGTDVSDYFNYGFDEFTWALYSLKQEKTRAQVAEDKKGFTMAMEGGGLPLPGMAGVPGAAGGMAMPPMPDLASMGPDMMAQMAQMAQMMGPAFDPSQIDPSMFGMAQASGAAQPGGPAGPGPAGAGTGGGAGAPPGYGAGQAGYGPGGPAQSAMGYGYDANMMGADANRNRSGNFGGRGRGQGRRNW